MDLWCSDRFENSIKNSLSCFGVGFCQSGSQLEGWVCGVNFWGTCDYVTEEAQIEGWDFKTEFTVSVSRE